MQADAVLRSPKRDYSTRSIILPFQSVLEESDRDLLLFKSSQCSCISRPSAELEIIISMVASDLLLHRSVQAYPISKSPSERLRSQTLCLHAIALQLCSLDNICPLLTIRAQARPTQRQLSLPACQGAQQLPALLTCPSFLAAASLLEMTCSWCSSGGCQEGR